jgi:alkanesulfonate monooxygenase SsuD/methylene tetrahydromethanopterin reductase-like flavin-dependent oxidoreductase (luciferase family)
LIRPTISGGREEIGVSLGHAVREFRDFGLPVSHRLPHTDEGLDVLTRAFTGERVSLPRHVLRRCRRCVSRQTACSRADPPRCVAVLAEAGAWHASALTCCRKAHAHAHSIYGTRRWRKPGANQATIA